MLGPKAQQLKQYVDAADEDALFAAGDQWTKGEQLLRTLSQQIATRGRSFGTDERFSGDTAEAASTAFQHSAAKMQDRADQMHQGAQAFREAAHGVTQARKVSNQLDAHAGDQPPTQPPDKSDAKAQSHYQTQNRQFWNSYADSETSAGHAITALNHNHQRQAEVFQSIHGETPPPAVPAGGGGSGGGRAAAPPPVTHLPNSGPVRHADPGGPVIPHHDPGPTTVPGGGHGPHGGNGGPSGPTTMPGPGHAPAVHAPGPYGVPAGPGGVTPPTPLASPLGGAALPAGGSGVGAVGGVGAVAGGALGGAAAAGLAGGLSGGLSGLNGMVPVGGGPGGLSASGVRGIGTSARTGVGSVLGRGSGAAGGRAGAGGTAGRSGRGGSGRGSRGAAGSRRTRAGAGAGSARGGKDKKRDGEERDLFDDGADWLDDEDAAPGVLD